MKLKGQQRRTLTLLGILAGASVLLAGLVVWRIAEDSADVKAPPPANEYVVFFVEDLNVAEQLTELRRHPRAEFIQAGKLPGVAVVRLTGDTSAGLRALRQDAAVFQVQKSVTGMVCH